MITVDEIIAARTGIRYRHLKEADKLDALDGILKCIYAMKGYTVADDTSADIAAIIGGLKAKIDIRHPDMFLNEIRLAWELGVEGELSQDKRLTIANFLRWLSDYKVCPERGEAMKGKQVFTPLAAPSSLLAPEELAKRNREATIRGITRAWRYFKANRQLEPSLPVGWAARLYDFLEDEGKANASAETKEKARKWAENQKNSAFYVHESPKGGLSATARRRLLELYFSSLLDRGAELQLRY